jgi:hypothetical protein
MTMDHFTLIAPSNLCPEQEQEPGIWFIKIIGTDRPAFVTMVHQRSGREFKGLPAAWSREDVQKLIRVSGFDEATHVPCFAGSVDGPDVFDAVGGAIAAGCDAVYIVTGWVNDQKPRLHWTVLTDAGRDLAECIGS